MEEVAVGFMGGTGMKTLGGERHGVSTHYGNVQVEMGEENGKRFAFIDRHAAPVPPHRINYKANITALRELRAKSIIATTTCGIIQGYLPGDMMMVRDFLGHCLGSVTFFE